LKLWSSDGSVRGVEADAEQVDELVEGRNLGSHVARLPCVATSGEIPGQHRVSTARATAALLAFWPLVGVRWSSEQRRRHQDAAGPDGALATA